MKEWREGGTLVIDLMHRYLGGGEGGGEGRWCEDRGEEYDMISSGERQRV